MKKNETPIILPIDTAREDLRLRALGQAAILTRSVSRLTSDDAQPCLEYGEEILAENHSIDELLYAQYCRKCLEQCISSGSAALRYRFQDGRVAATRFRRISLSRVKIWGLA